jgi:signal transduction histidine kinase
MAGVLWFLLPASPGRSAEVLAPLFRFAVILGLLTGLLVYLQTVFQKTTSQHNQSQNELEDLVSQRTAALQESQERLERASASLSEGEKLASLGRIVAGIAHEMNTPLGAIQASSTHLAEQTSRVLSSWTHLIPKLGSDQADVLLALVDEAETSVNQLDSRRIREQRKVIARRLQALAVPDAEGKGRILADLGVKDFRDSWLPLLLSPAADSLLQGVTDLVEWRRAVSIIQLSTSKVADQVNGLRRYSTNPKTGKAFVPVDLSHNIETVLLVYRSQFPKGVKIVREFASHGPWVQGNPDKLMQVWSNLIMNAIQALGSAGKLTLEARSGRQWAHVKVTDNGPGIPSEIQQKVLEPFFSTKSNGEGMGLGLKIVATIVAEHGGDLSFESEPGRTMFRVRLPIAEVPSKTSLR